MNARDLVSRVDDDCLAGFLIAQQGAVALQGADRKGLENHVSIVERRELGVRFDAKEADLAGLPQKKTILALNDLTASAGYLPDLAGAEEAGLVSSSTECERFDRTKSTVSDRDVIMKMIADQVVRRVSTLAAARGPKAVCEPWPPNAPARSAERPC
jgi:hypothetical protein